jgi:hypothetical protein
VKKTHLRLFVFALFAHAACGGSAVTSEPSQTAPQEATAPKSETPKKEKPAASETPKPQETPPVVEPPVPTDPVPTEPPVPVDPTDFSARGPRTVTKTEGTLALAGCDLSYTDMTPDGATAPALVILGHGFQRRMRHMVGLAEHLASFGLRVVAVDYCHSTILDTDHAQNGLDALALAGALAPATTPVIYAGQSAGGIAAVVAAAQDPRAIGVLGLDLTDSDDIGLNAAETLLVPGLGLLGESSSCNASGNGAAVFGAMSAATKLKITGGTHCDFELPTTVVCTVPCGAQAADRSLLVRGLSAAFVAWKSGVDVTGEAWVTQAGSTFTSLSAAGKVSLVP